MNRKSLLLLTFFVGASLSPLARAAMQTEVAAAALPEVSGASSQEDALYAQGTKAMDEQRWSDAVTAFDGVAAAKGKRADAGLYWKAYSLDKLGRKDEARAVCDSLHKEQPSSSWNRECIVLRARSQVDPAALRDLARQTAQLNVDVGDLNVKMSEDWGDGPRAFYFDSKGKHATTEDDIKLLAVNALMRQDPAKALPILRDMVHSNQSIEFRRQALFVLSRSKDPQAQTIMTEIATTKGDPELQREAIQMLAINRGKDAGPTLVEIYRGATDAGVKRAAVNGLFLSHDAPHLVELARGEKDLNLKRDIVSQLALMKDPAATDYMLELLK
jgi:HEAT repeat protein